MQADPLSSAMATLSAGLESPLSASPSLGSGAAGAPPFSDLLQSAIANVNQLDSQATTAVQGLMSGAGVDVHQAMIATQKSQMAFEMALAVRNRAVTAYQQVMQMQF
ncbi:flagellar hook-basal body complex protein FliE [Silvibacterium bohemicum]|uniref:Flagellar hook-basal body complex protein FliE n=1 Tax=Silvibacterium bohemicum TaxID=1577686 RepID=A0A841K9I6_9BACT|nr:flagellar hook-basal body complex protein FliE [Silvibacterium bohemicum]MBB6147218.1 flagellar hook-basal body complex protein FliE [Silvibacterium bohemicum]